MVLLVATATPAAINSGASFGGLIASIIMIGLGTGGLKSCIAPLCGEQNTDQGERLTTLRTGEVVIVDGKLTTARIFLWYVRYWSIKRKSKLTRLQVLLGGQHRLLVSSHYCPCGESPLVLACLSHPTHVSNILDRILGIKH
jgi:hypothetical protein